MKRTKKSGFGKTLIIGSLLGLAGVGYFNYKPEEKANINTNNIANFQKVQIVQPISQLENALNQDQIQESIASISNEGLKLIKESEGFRTRKYLDAAGKPTIGYGHLIKDGENLEEIDEAYAENLLREDVSTAENAIKRYVKVPINQNQYDALTSFVFNLGSKNFENSNLRKKLNSGDYTGASEELTRWVYAGGRKLKGLETRREKERKLFLRN